MDKAHNTEHAANLNRFIASLNAVIKEMRDCNAAHICADRENCIIIADNNMIIADLETQIVQICEIIFQSED
jgi:hypothetical protein